MFLCQRLFYLMWEKQKKYNVLGKDFLKRINKANLKIRT